MKTCLLMALLLLIPGLGTAGENDSLDPIAGEPPPHSVATFGGAIRAQPKLLRISGSIDGSGRIVFTGDQVRYEHKHWGWPAHLVFDGEPWSRLDCCSWQSVQHQASRVPASRLTSMCSTPEGIRSQARS